MATDNNDPAYARVEQLMALRERVSAVEGDIKAIKATLEQMDRRLGNVEGDIRELRREVLKSFRWTVGIILSTTIPTILMVLLTLLKVVGVL